MRVCCKLETTKCLGDRFTYGFLTNQLLLHDKLVPIIVLIKEKVGRRMDIVSFTSRCQRCSPMPYIFYVTLILQYLHQGPQRQVIKMTSIITHVICFF